jgi:UDP-N-acetylglucosamine--N-acetylmuramyl-(pentapeptide) pyrophosphoryl-undecaprenol N-acetylglucosamine transferase
MRVLIAAGGTGGHLFPALAIAQELRRQKPAAEILFLGSDRGLEKRVVPREGFAFASVPIRGWSRKASWQAFVFPWFLLRALWRSLLILRRFRPAVVVGTGGYVSGPALFLATLMGIPSLIQEQNSLPGITTRILSPRVDQVHLSFPRSCRYFRKKRHLKVSGNPLRLGLSRLDREKAWKTYGFAPHRKTVLVMGGSQGAHSINMAVAQGFDSLVSEDVQLIWQTGKGDFDQIHLQFADRGPKTVVADFIQNMGSAYGAADVVVCRAGATTVAEITACGLPAIFVPYPFATDDHQRINAQVLVTAGAAEMVLNGELKGDKLIALLLALLRDDRRLKEMARKSRMLGRPDAAQNLALAIRELAGGV